MTKPAPPKRHEDMTPAERQFEVARTQFEMQRRADEAAARTREAIRAYYTERHVATAKAGPLVDEIEAACRRHGVSIAWDHSEEAFAFVPFTEAAMMRLREATRWVPNPYVMEGGPF